MTCFAPVRRGLTPVRTSPLLLSDKYPLEDEYSKFLAEVCSRRPVPSLAFHDALCTGADGGAAAAQNGGNSNAYTDTESTNYHFTVRADTFEPALDRFAQFFICPQISENGVAREMNAVDSEVRPRPRTLNPKRVSV